MKRIEIDLMHNEDYSIEEIRDKLSIPASDKGCIACKDNNGTDYYAKTIKICGNSYRCHYGSYESNVELEIPENIYPNYKLYKIEKNQRIYNEQMVEKQKEMVEKLDDMVDLMSQLVSSINQLNDTLLYGPGVGVEYNKAKEEFESLSQN